jgi:predicted AAA+ superfamily ATPase
MYNLHNVRTEILAICELNAACQKNRRGRKVMTLTEKGYKTRLIDKEISEILNIFGALSIEGPKFCGKTWTALNHANSVTYIADPAGGFLNRQRAIIDPALVLEGDSPHLVDEWQEVPGIWDAVRFAVDRGSERGRFILTGSAMPPKKSVIHSGVGRIESVRMRPLSLFESGASTGAVSLQSLFSGEAIKPNNSASTLETLIDKVVRGGWPESQDLPVDGASRIAQNYLTRLITKDLAELDGVARDPGKVNATLTSLARNNSTLVANTTIQKDVDAGNKTITRETVTEYLSAFKRLYVLEEIPAWAPQVRSRTMLRKTPKRLFTDPSLAVAALGLSPERLSDDLKTFGFMFENLCLRDLAVYADTFHASLFHYLDDTGLDADAIIAQKDGTWGAFEVKLGRAQIDDAAAKLIRLGKKIVKNGNQPPACLVVITGLGGFAHKREDSVYVVPIDCLMP